MKRTAWALLGAALLLGGAEGGCGAGFAANVALSPSAMGGGSLSWSGFVPGRALAVGTRKTLTFEGAGCCRPGYAVTSSAPEVLSVTDRGNQTVEIRALSAGSADIEVTAAGSLVGDLPLLVEAPSQIVFAEQSHFAAQITGDTELPQSFSVVGQVVVQAVIEDELGNPLDSQGLSSCASNGQALGVSGDPAQELWTLSPQPSSYATNSASASLTCGLVGAPSTSLTYDVHVAYAAASAQLAAQDQGDGTVNVVADAFDDAGRETYGLAWAFSFTGPGSVTAQPLAGGAAEQFFVGLDAPLGSVVVTATSGELAPAIAIP